MAASFTILGSGSSGGVPRPALGWGACNPANPKNRRRRTSLLVERRTAAGVTRVLVDTSPDLREQLLEAEIDWLDAVLFTHEHADHTHGIDDLRGLFIHRRKRDGARRARRLDRRCAALHAAPEPFQRGRDARVDRAPQAAAGDPDQPAFRPRLRRAAEPAANACGARLRWPEPPTGERRSRL